MTTSGFNRPADPVSELGARLAAAESAIRDLSRPRAFAIPILSTDPPESDPTNLWMFPDGRLRGRHKNAAGTAFVYREWVATAPGSNTSATAPAAPAAAPVTQLGAWDAVWTQSYRGSGAARTDNGATHLYYGYVDSFNGRNRSLAGFDHASIATTLAGSTIISVQLRLTNVHAYYGAGADIHFGIHNFSSEPASWAGGGIPRSMISKHHFGKPETRTVTLPVEFAQAIRDGWGKGIALESPSDSRSYYGYAGGVGSGQPVPRLLVTYAK